VSDESVTRCATCRFMAEPRSGTIETWDDEAETSYESEHRTCTRIIHGNGYKERLDHSRTFQEPALVTDGSGYAARLVVLPTFGCVLHEAKR